MIPGLLGLYALRDHLEQAITALELVRPAVEAWQDAQENAAEKPAQAREGKPIAPDEPGALSGAPRPIEEPSEPAPTPPNGVAGADPGEQVECEFCQAPFVRDRGPGARRRYCNASCRAKASEARARAREQEAAAEPGLEPLPAQVARPFMMIGPLDDPRSDPTLLQPPALVWE